MRSCPREFLAFLPIRLPGRGHVAGGFSVVLSALGRTGQRMFLSVPLKLRGYSDFIATYSHRSLRTDGRSYCKMSGGKDDFGFNGSNPGIGNAFILLVTSSRSSLYAS